MLESTESTNYSLFAKMGRFSFGTLGYFTFFDYILSIEIQLFLSNPSRKNIYSWHSMIFSEQEMSDTRFFFIATFAILSHLRDTCRKIMQ